METKLFATAQVKEVKEDGTIIGAVASSGSLDRDEEILDPEGWELDNFRKNPVLLWSHDARLLPLGRITGIKTNEKGELIFDAIFASKENDFANKVANLMSSGFLNSFSVGFNPKEKDGNTFVKQELLEISVVNVPANPDARVSREFKELQEMEKKLESKEEVKSVEEKLPEYIPEKMRNLLRLVRDTSNELLSNTKAVQKGKVKNIKVEPRIAEKANVKEAKKAVRLIQKATEHAARCLKENK